ncbi:MAG: hypothetical protein DYG98_17890 [Haliscomenobacteraceae bacterium CHB4]|nr:hypothetical protein [Saprospiraceae bacterium]MCE7924927.1 hypothetical protein [Haliscomenobacteraceae bacterium CHB4]
MKNFKNQFLAVLAVGSMALTGCLHIIEEVTFKDKGTGNYALTLDMSEVKGMMDMLQTMSPDSAGGEMPAGQDNSMAQMGQEISGVASTLKGIQGITNVVELNDTAAFKFGYSFDFADVAALNRALKVVNKDKYDSKVEEVFKFTGKSFERLSAGDMGEEIKKALSESEGEEGGEEAMDMMKMMFADMSYKQIYHFPDREIKKSSNALAELSDNNHTMTITLKPFDEEQQSKKVSVATEVKLK